MSIVIVHSRGKHKGKYVRETPSNPYWDEVSIDIATTYRDKAEAYKKIDELCAKVGDDLPMLPVEII